MATPLLDVLLPGSTRAASQARSAVRNALTDADLTHHVQDLCLIVSELVTNAVVHAGSEVRVRLTHRGATVRIEVQDSADGDPRVLAADTDATGGRGLAIVAATAQRWGTQPHRRGKIVWAEL